MSILRVAGIALMLCLSGPTRASEAATPTVQRQYVNGPYGQIHVRIARPASRSAERHPPLVCFHYTPGSSRMYAALLPHLATDRVVIAVDTPGYGGSDAPAAQPTLAEYAVAITAGLK
jgi:pimeloyl-ACP methyl ester carboxylesterase